MDKLSLRRLHMLLQTAYPYGTEHVLAVELWVFYYAGAETREAFQAFLRRKRCL